MMIDAKQYGGECLCGGRHSMETRLCIIEEGALSRFEDVIAQLDITGKRCAVYDTNTYMAENLVHVAAEQEIILDANGLHANEISTAEVLNRLEPDIKVLIAVGGGTVHDIVRYCAKQRGISFVSVPTAASCDGFCSNVAAMTWEGYKNTMSCGSPVLVVADISVIRKAPRYLTNSGVGDMLGKYIALSDWRMANLLTGEPVCERIFKIMKEAVDCIKNSVDGIVNGEAKAYEAVTYGLLMSGLAIQMLGTSRPASGAEHHISHLIETEPEALSVHSDALHGEKVGVGTILAAEEYHRLAQTEDIAPYVIPYQPIDENQLRSFFGEALYPVAKRENENDSLANVTEQAIINSWPDIRKIISEIPDAEELERLLITLGAKHSLADIGVPNQKRQILLDKSPLIRNRLTLMRVRRMLLH